MLQIVLNIRMFRSELACPFIDEIASLCNGKRNDLGLSRCHLFNCPLPLFGRVDVVHNGADYTSRLLLRASLDDGVKEVLPLEGIAHAVIALQHTHAALTPSLGAVECEQVVQISGLVSTMESANPDVNGVLTQFAAIIRRNPNFFLQLG